MPQKIVILSGPVCSGKTTLAESLESTFKVKLFKTRQFLRERGAKEKIPSERGAMQTFGDYLDRRTGGSWVRDDLLQKLSNVAENDVVVLDAIRIKSQIEALRSAFGLRVFHVHLTASLDELRQRYRDRPEKDLKEFKTYDEVLQNNTEKMIHRLEKEADVVIHSDRCTKKDVLIRIASHIGLYGREYLRLVDVIVGGQFGSEGKGQVVGYLAREYDWLVRVGGSNAGHTVYVEPTPYTFHHLPSGTLTSEARLLIGPGAVLNVNTLLREIADCKVDKDRLKIDPQAMTIDSEDMSNEGDLVKRIGSTGQGVGYATSRRVLRLKSVKLAGKIKALNPFLQPAREVLERAFHERERVLLEGTQGTGLSLYHGFFPHVTSRDTTVAGCLAEAGISPNRVQRVIMVCRTYPIRVQSPKDGDSGHMSKEITWEEVAARCGKNADVLRKAELTSTTKRQRRVSEFDWELLRFAASLNAPTDIALTFADYISPKNEKARRFEQLTPETIQFIEEIERVASAPVTLISTRFHQRSIIDRRMW